MPNFAANLTMLFQEYDFLDRFEAAANADFRGVEYLFPYDYDPRQLAELLHTHNLQQVLHNLPAGNWGAGERGIAAQHSQFHPGPAPQATTLARRGQLALPD
jgi:hydroxypyruvate isomerase